MYRIVFFSLFCFGFICNIGYSQPKNVLIDNNGTPNEPSIIINYKNPTEVLAASNINNYYVSSDSGKTWIEKHIESQYGVWGDPALAVDTNGYFYFFHLSTAEHWIDRIVAQRSEDGGNTWTQDTFMGYFEDKDQDKEWPVVDPKTNNIYVTWTQFDNYGSKNANDSTHILFSKSTDAGLTWSDAKRIDRFGGDCIDSDNTVEGAVPAVGPKGQIYVAWAGPQGLVFDRSYDQCTTWMKKDIVINDIPGGWDFDIPGISRCNGLPVTVCDLSKGPNNGNIYINWSDQRNGENDTDIWVVKSEDEGNTWSKPKRVNDDLLGRHQFFSWMTIDQKTGYLYIVFYDRRNYNDNNTDVYMAVSKDGGDTFENYKISETPFEPSKNVFFGDYTNISAYDNMVRPIWTRLDNHKLSIWTALIDIENISSTVDLEFKNDLLKLENAPNPVKDKFVISFKLRKKANISITLFDSLGIKLNDIISGKEFEFGKHIVEIDIARNNLKPGIYFYTIKYDNYIKTKKFIVYSN